MKACLKNRITLFIYIIVKLIFMSIAHSKSNQSLIIGAREKGGGIYHR